ncbi:unnamed protein product [Vitrella brassicaformis CCMP3155]|uniref:non-specific serine/threonine protein kinase n=2 Tax=Vitrella brassicaformis TaxID=1169539 RepID=A0A0G4H1U3_VITBC|nr:unnamed protein product [Vitrella brassicaformis CCMP3155]|eukprot:CEM37596.1 unnamed protein product [Vitrella brassicaformis CCMP3155]
MAFMIHSAALTLLCSHLPLCKANKLAEQVVFHLNSQSAAVDTTDVECSDTDASPEPSAPLPPSQQQCDGDSCAPQPSHADNDTTVTHPALHERRSDPPEATRTFDRLCGVYRRRTDHDPGIVKGDSETQTTSGEWSDREGEREREREREVTTLTFPLTSDNVAALVLLGGLCFLGCIYLWKLMCACARQCKCRMCTGAYKMIHQLGGGGYGTVWLTERESDGHLFVIKRIPVEDITEADTYTNEAKRLISLRHKYIVAYEEDFIHTSYTYGSFEPHFTFVIVMEYCPEGDMKQKIENEHGGFCEDSILKWFHQVCQAVYYLHERNVIHRDIKSQNIFLTENGDIRLGDFGLSRPTQRQSIANKKGGQKSAMTQAGTECYMAPEMLSSSRYGKPADVWSLGCVLLEMCSGTFMWELDGLLGAQVMQEARCIHEMVDALPPAIKPSLRTLIKRLLHPDPSQRPTLADLLRKKVFKRNYRGARETIGGSPPVGPGVRAPAHNQQLADIAEESDQELEGGEEDDATPSLWMKNWGSRSVHEGEFGRGEEGEGESPLQGCNKLLPKFFSAYQASEPTSAGTAEDGGNTQHEGGSETTRTPSPATPFAWTNDRRGGPLPPVLTPADGEFQLPPQSTTGSRKKRNRGGRKNKSKGRAGRNA